MFALQPIALAASQAIRRYCPSVIGARRGIDIQPGRIESSGTDALRWIPLLNGSAAATT